MTAERVIVLAAMLSSAMGMVIALVAHDALVRLIESGRVSPALRPMTNGFATGAVFSFIALMISTVAGIVMTIGQGAW